MNTNVGLLLANLVFAVELRWSADFIRAQARFLQIAMSLESAPTDDQLQCEMIAVALTLAYYIEAANSDSRLRGLLSSDERLAIANTLRHWKEFLDQLGGVVGGTDKYVIGLDEFVGETQQ